MTEQLYVARKQFDIRLTELRARLAKAGVPGASSVADAISEHLLGNTTQQFLAVERWVQRTGSGVSGNYDATVNANYGGNNGENRTFTTVHAAAAFLGAIGLTACTILVTGTITETSALSSGAPATTVLEGHNATWNLNNLASTWNNLELRNITVTAGTTKATEVFTITSSGNLIFRNVDTTTGSFPSSPILICTAASVLYAYDSKIGNLTSAGPAYYADCEWSNNSRTFSGNITWIDGGTVNINNASRTWTVSSTYVIFDGIAFKTGTGFGNTLTITVSAAHQMYARWAQAANPSTPTQNPMYAALTISSTNLKSCVVDGAWLGALTVSNAPLVTALLSGAFASADIQGPAQVNLSLGEQGGNGTGAITVRGRVSGNVSSTWALTGAQTCFNGVAWVGGVICMSVTRSAGAVGTTKGYALDASSTRNVLVFPRNVTAAGVFGAASTNAGALNVVIDENGATPALHASTHLPSGSDPLTTAAAGTIQPDDSAAVGTAESFARSDHRHAIVAAAPGAIAAGDAAAEGTATSFARSDHTHSSPSTWPPRKFSATLASGSTSYNVDHNFNTLDVIVEVYDSSTGVKEYPTITHSTVNRVVVDFSVATTADKRAVVIG